MSKSAADGGPGSVGIELRLVDEQGCTSTFMTPAHFIRILEVPEDERAKLQRQFIEAKKDLSRMLERMERLS